MKKESSSKIKDVEYWETLVSAIGPQYSFVRRPKYRELVIRCEYHGEFTYTGTTPTRARCKKCAEEQRAQVRVEEFIKSATEKFGAKYDYSLVTPTTIGHLNEKVTVICPEHGNFEVTPQNHIQRGTECRHCSGTRLSTKSFIEKSKEKYGMSSFNYGSLPDSEFIAKKSSVELYCIKHNHSFVVNVTTHLLSKNGGGCKHCRGEGRRRNPVDSKHMLQVVHESRYDYLHVPQSSQDFAIVVCPQHGKFKQRLYSHMAGHGCPQCAAAQLAAVSSQEHVVASWFPDEEIITNARGVIGRKELDIVFVQRDVAVEIDSGYWHSALYRPDKKYHQDKQDRSSSLGINLLQFWDFEIDQKGEIVRSIISQKIGLVPDRVIYARQCEIAYLSKSEYAKFLSDNHLQGEITSRVKLGLSYKGEIVCVMGATLRQGTWYIDRFASKVFTRVQGGFSKLLKNSGINGRIVTHSANRYSEGSLYLTQGFNLVSETDYTLFYTYAGKVYPRNKFQKHKLKDWDNYSSKKTADEILAEKNIFPVYHSGTKTWEAYL